MERGRVYGFYILDCFLGFVPRRGITRAQYTLSNCFPTGLYPLTVPMPESSIILNKKSLFNVMIKKVLLSWLKQCFFNCLQHKVVLTHFLCNSCFGPLYLLDFNLFSLLKGDLFYFAYAWMSVHCTCALHVCTACRGQKRMLDTL